jgi:hypothetical protein
MRPPSCINACVNILVKLLSFDPITTHPRNKMIGICNQF